MREYETLFVTQPNLPDSDLGSFNEKLGAIIQKHDGRLFFAKSMGKRNLAYPINKQTKGVYTCLDFTAKGACVSEIERFMRLDENFLRFLTVVKNEEVDVEKRLAEIVARGEDTAPVVAETTLPPVEVADNGLEEEE